MRIVSWNINSLRLRLGLLKKLIDEENPDIICLQETKVPDEFFPYDEIINFGYPYVVYRGEKSYNGVTIISKIELTIINKINMVAKEESRHISAFLPNGIEIHNIYIPAGGDEPDVIINPKFQHKLDYIDGTTDFFTKERKLSDKMIVLGDFNTAPLENDVWSHKQLLNVISHTPIEVEKLNKLQQSLDWVDITRHFIDHSQKIYSWWSYRNRDWRKSNRGRRLDHIWASNNLQNNLKAHKILSCARDWSSPSDHVPVIADFNFS